MPLDAADHRPVLVSPLSSQRLGKRIHGTLSNVVRGLFIHLARDFPGQPRLGLVQLESVVSTPDNEPEFPLISDSTGIMPR